MYWVFLIGLVAAAAGLAVTALAPSVRIGQASSTGEAAQAGQERQHAPVSAE